jgi:mannose-6-phosphate isomerase-like protein (cupin superfamily)
MIMTNELIGGKVFDPSELTAGEYLPNRGVFLTGILGKQRGDGFGFYFGRMEAGCEIAREIHPETSETVYVLSGEAVGLVGEREVPLKAGQVLHVDKNIHHGLKNVGPGPLEFLVIGHPDF